MEEEWRDIPEYEGRYLISSLGRVRSNLLYRGKRGRCLKPFLDSNGYPQVYLFGGPRGGEVGLYRRRRKMRIHTLVLLAFVGPKPEYGDYVCHHIDGDKLNNSLYNLCWVPRNVHNHRHEGENADCIRINFEKLYTHTKSMGFTEEDVLNIRRSYKSPEDFGRLSRKYEVSTRSIFGVVLGVI